MSEYKNKKIRLLMTVLGPLATSLLLMFCFIPWNIEPLIWVSLIPWFYTLSRAKSYSEAAIQGFLLSIFFTVGIFYWMVFVMNGVLKFSLSVSLLIFFVYSLLAQTQFVVFSLLMKHLSQSKQIGEAALIFLGVIAYALIESLAPHFFQDTLAFALHKDINLIQFAEFTGVRGLTAVIVLVNFVLFYSLKKIQTKKYQEAARGVLLIGAFLAALHLWGHSIFTDWTNRQNASTQTAKISVIQANVSMKDKLESETGPAALIHRVVDKYLSLSKQAVSSKFHPDVIVWPETAYPTEFEVKHFMVDAQMKIRNFVRETQSTLLFGGYDQDFNSNSNAHYNTYFFLEPNQTLQKYRKSHLVPFVEYMPGFENSDWVKKNIPQIYGLTRGGEPKVYSVKNLKVGPLICYEAIHPYISTHYKNLGANLLLNITNVAWFNPFLVAEVLLSSVVYRAIETRLPVVVSTNTGIGALIHPAGDIVGRGPANEMAILEYSVPMIESKPTLYSLYGERWLWALAAIALGLYVYWMRRGRVHASS